MFTDCPACGRLFRINAAQLTAAQGQVKCGYCGQQFNALERLHDTPAPDEADVKPHGDERITEQPEPQFDIPEDPAGRMTEEPSGSEGGDISASGTEKKAPEIHVPAPLNTGISEADLVEELLMDDPVSPQRSGQRLFWSLGTVVLILLGTIMILWFQRDFVLSRYPLLMPWAERLCEKLDCNLIRFRDVGKIVLINRDVRDHPRYENALLVNATMSNRSQIRQPFPNIQLSLYDTNGVLIAHRIFVPGDYLDDSIDISQGMMPEIPVHFVLEVTGPTEGAVSFEFKFL